MVLTAVVLLADAPKLPAASTEFYYLDNICALALHSEMDPG